MQVLSAKLVLTGVLATLLWAVPVSIDLGRPGSADASMSSALGIGLKIDSAAAARQPSTWPCWFCSLTERPVLGNGGEGPSVLIAPLRRP